MTTYQITPVETGVAIELTNVGDKQQDLLSAFGECQAGVCSCPTNEYEKVASMEMVPSADAIRIELRAKPGTEFDAGEIAACLDYTVEKAGR
jgi:hypothetical protein